MRKDLSGCTLHMRAGGRDRAGHELYHLSVEK
uniref:Uncharacterized protein n=1 Tax=Arundo donax TaxID=35708 RepID=A0A0A9FCE6_ARUDO